MNKLRTIAVISLLALGSNAMAGTTTTGNLKSTAKLNSLCTLSITDFKVENYNPITTAQYYISGALTTICSRGVIGSSIPAINDMKNVTTGEKFTYVLVHSPTAQYPNGIYPWGDAYPLNITGTGQTVISPLFMLINPQKISPGIYTEAVTVTMTY